ncbi:class I SAM-dependent methyltransferase [Dethiobacter alkaliphilus]|uniref:Methyltransferase type 11 n=1 Tax=Dethiobacter alkaliphilus AHT 1 TaxID=555088 RepID=C0GKK0_DETAL|nr:class I SAM-dependent methyltransferase [Dethiobacter alkaliphilus]EEG76167.1 Methyltransferase type 11 [Dethiobacter alkaliphilus AHT 1]MCW3490428.1 methyltransferase domain-containing protein [Dethiobacter alkaliphilus]
MREETLDLLCDPETSSPLILQENEDGSQVLAGSNTTYPIRDGVADFLHQKPVTGINKRYQMMYDHLSPFYNFVTRAAIRLMQADEDDVRREYLCELEIKPGDRVLEVSVGTGTNLRLLPRDARYYGLDISPGQLRQCKKLLKKIGLEAELFLGAAESLPFYDNSFDVVFHMGGINFFGDPDLALREMYRVAKPGTKIVVVDETDRFTKKLAKIPIVQNFFKSDSDVNVPDPLVPQKAEDIQVKELFDGRLWYLSFRKAQTKVKPATVSTALLKRRALQRV